MQRTPQFASRDNPHGIQECDTYGTITYCNTSFCQITGYDKDELAGKKIWDFFDSEPEQRGLEAYFLNIVREKPPPTPYISKIRTKDGRPVIIQVDWNYKWDSYENLTGFVSIITDITERKQFEETLEVRAHQQAVLSKLGQRALADTDLAALIDEAVNITARTLGVEYCKVLELLPDGNALILRAGVGWKEGFIGYATVGAGTNSQAGYTLLSNEPVIVKDFRTETRFSGPPLLHEHGIISGMSVIICDVKKPYGVLGAHTAKQRAFTQDDVNFLQNIANILATAINRKQAEKEMQKMQKLESIGTLAGGIAHDFNNMLTTILGNISLSKMYLNTDDKIFERLTDAEDACMDAKELSYRLLTFSKGGKPFRKTTLISKLVKETVYSLLGDTNISCEFNLSGNLYPVYIDIEQIKQVITNLVINAGEAMPEGGVLKVYANNVTVTKKDNLPVKEGNHVKLSIEDNGKGIPEENLSKLFDPYFTTKEIGSQKGMGLGLTACYSIIKRHEGLIKVESTSGTGTTFHIYLPASEIQSLAKGGPQKRKRILLMDDEPSVIDIEGRLLGYMGYEVEYSTNGNEAVELYRQAKENSQPFDVVILDLIIPEGMGGDTIMNKLLEIDPEVKGIVTSGYLNNPILTDFRKYGFVDALVKPYNLQQLGEVLERVLKGTF